MTSKFSVRSAENDLINYTKQSFHRITNSFHRNFGEQRFAVSLWFLWVILGKFGKATACIDHIIIMLNKSKGQEKTNRITEIDEHIRRNFDMLKVMKQNVKSNSKHTLLILCVGGVWWIINNAISKTQQNQLIDCYLHLIFTAYFAVVSFLFSVMVYIIYQCSE